MTEFRSREAQSFLAGLSRPEEVQEEFLRKQVLAPNVGCEFGQRIGFDKLKSIEDYQKAIPIGKYDAFAAMIDADRQWFVFDGFVRSFYESSATVRAVVEYRDETNTMVLDAFDSGATLSPGAWMQLLRRMQ